MLADWQDQVVVNFIMATGGGSGSVSSVSLFCFMFSSLTTAELPHTIILYYYIIVILKTTVELHKKETTTEFHSSF